MRPSTHNQNRQTAARVSWLLVTYPVTLLLVNGSCLQHLRRHSRPFALHKQIRIVYKIMIAFERFYVWSEHEKSARLWVGSGGLGVSPCVCVCVWLRCFSISVFVYCFLSLALIQRRIPLLASECLVWKGRVWNWLRDSRKLCAHDTRTPMTDDCIRKRDFLANVKINHWYFS